MKKESRLTRVGLTVLICTILLIIAISYLAFQKIRNEACRLVCSVNLKGLGTAMTVYASDYEDNFPQLPGIGPWSHDLGFPFYLEKPSFSEAQSTTPRTITASLYLLVREADVSPKSFICPRSEKPFFEGNNPNNLDLVNLWDFGINPYEHVSYAYHNPYGNFPSNTKLPSSFAIAADRSPWFENGNILYSNTSNNPPQTISLSNHNTFKLGNSIAHKSIFNSKRTGQNILYADGRMLFSKQPNAGIKNDNIYTFWSTEENPTEQDIQGGTAPSSRSPENDAKSRNDSFLAI